MSYLWAKYEGSHFLDHVLPLTRSRKKGALNIGLVPQTFGLVTSSNSLSDGQPHLFIFVSPCKTTMKCVYLVSLSYLWPTRIWCSGGNSWSHHRTVDKIAERPRSMQRTLLEQDSRQSARLIRKTRNEITPPVGVYLLRFILHCNALCRGSRLLEEGCSMTSSPENVEISSPRKRNFRHSEAKSACFKLSRFFITIIPWARVGYEVIK